MKKFFTLMILLLAGFMQVDAAMWLVGDAFNGWSESGNVAMTQSGTTYTWTGELTAGKYFAFFKDTQGWSYQRGPLVGDAAPSGDWESTKSGGAWKLATSGTYTIEYNYSTDQAKIALQTSTPFDDTARKFAVTGAAFGGWNMPPSAEQTFTNNGDGTYTLVYTGAVAGEFKLTSVGANDVFDSSWSVFNGGCMGKSSLAEGDNDLSSSFGTGNMTFPVSGDVTLTISNVTESSCKLNIAVNTVVVPEKAWYIAGDFTSWGKQAMTENANGSFSITINGMSTGNEFKFVDEYDAWYGGTTDDETYGVHPDWCTDIEMSTTGKNFAISSGSGDLTFTISADGKLSVTGWDTTPVTPELKLIGGFNSWDETTAVSFTENAGVYTLTQTFDSDSEFKFLSGTTWYGTTESATLSITEDNKNDIALSTDGGASNFSLPAGEWTFTVNLAAGTFSVAGTWPVVPVQNDVYILGNGGWDASVGVQMETTDDVNYSKTITTADSGDGYAYIGFSTKLGSSSTDWDGIAAYRFGPEADGENYWITETTINTDIAYVTSNYKSIRIPAGMEVTVSVNKTAQTFRVAGTWPAPADPEVYLFGSFDSWATGLQMTKEATGNVYTLTTTFAAESEFKFLEGSTWYGTTESAVQAITEATKDNIATSTDGGAQNFSLPAGEWTFTFNLDNGTFSVAGTWPEPLKVYILGNGNSSSWYYNTGVEMSTNDNVNFTANITVNNYGTGYNTIGFTTKLASTWNGSSEISANRFGPSEQVTISSTNVGTDIPYVTSGYNPVRLVAGISYIVTVNTADQTFKVIVDPNAEADAYLVGTSSGWVINNSYKFTKGTDNLYHLDGVSLQAGEEFRITVQDGLSTTNYVAAENTVRNKIICEANHVNVPMGNEGSHVFYLRGADTYNITFDAVNKTLTVEKTGAWPTQTAAALYILGNTATWDPTDGVAMNTTDNVNFTYELTAADSGDGSAYIGFTTVLANTNDDAGWSSIAPYRLGPAAEGENYWITSETINTDIPFAVTGYKGVKIPAGATYTVTVNYNAMTFQVAGTIPTPSTAPDHLYFMGDQFGDWAYDAIAQGKVVELDKNGDVFTYTGHVDAGYFCLITQDAADWGDLDNYRYGKDNNDPEIAMDTQYTLTKGTDFHLTLAGTYTFTVDFSGTDPVFSFTGTPDPVSNAPEHLYFMGDNFGNWDAQAIANGTAVELTKNGDVFTYTGHVDAGWFCLITADGEGADADAQWADLNSNYRYGSNSDGNEEDVVADTQYTMAKGARTYHLTAAGTYTFTVDFSGANPVFSFTGTPDPVSNAPEHLYFIGNEFGGWDNAAIANGTAVELTKNGDIFTYTGHVGADGYFCFITQDGADWDDLDNYRYGSNDESTQEDVVMDTQYTMAKGKRSYHLAAAGTYTFTVDFSGANPVFSFTGTPDPVAAADLYLKGSFDTWGTGVQFTDNGDGTYTLADYVLADDTEFQVYDATSDTWYGHNGTAQIDGANHTDVALATGYANNFTIAAGTYTFVVDFDAKTMTVTGTWSTDLYLKGSFDTWGAGAQFTDNGDGTYTLADYVLADDTEFKVYDVGTDTWYGHNGTALINYANHENVTIAEGNDNNFSIAAGTYTFVVNFDNKTMTVSGNFVNPNAGKTLQLRGSFNTWGDTDVFTDNNDGTYTITLQMNKEDEFKIVEVVDPSDSNQDVWYGYNTGSADLFWLNGQARTNVAMEDGNNYYVAVSGEWTITVDYAAKTFNADRVIEKYGVLGDAAIFGTAWDNDVELEAMPIPGDYTVTLSNVDIAAGDYEYKARADKDWGWYDLPAAGNNTLNVPESGLYDITFTMSTLNHDIVAYLTPVTSIALTISDAEYATIYYENVAFEIPEGVTASTYKVQEGHMVASKNVTKNPAGQALVLYKAGGGDITLNIINTGMEAADNENLLVGSVFNEEGISEAGYTYFYLCRKDGTGKVGFYYFTADGSSVNNNAHKAYMRVPNDQVPAGVMGFAFDDALTGITGINAEEILSDGPVYTLSGVRVQNAANLQKGIYVKNGRKFIVK